MHLIGFHRVLIACAAVFFAGYGAWEIITSRGSDPLRLVLGVGALTAAAVLALYLSRLRRILRLPGPPDER